MSILVLQIIIKQWDKSQRSPQHVEQRAQIPNHYSLKFPPAIHVFDDQCVIDQHGDDLLGNRLNYLQPDSDTIQLDRFQINLSSKMLEYVAQPDSHIATRALGSLDNTWLQCKYNWRYGVDEGGFYYWLYEEVTLNAMVVNSLNENLFMNSKPEIVIDLA
ncbi:MAG: hypothetical protein MUQ51_04865 [Pseudomonadota bacterium]|nr:hypothetical protein [Pseudomonadota bacterium]MDO7710935.1 hypothetical protein [Pseudomonadota bacterium]